jgi:EAL domain-containing protein (putative c-di-GMP-specific phosphodiesterase class I)
VVRLVTISYVESQVRPAGAYGTGEHAAELDRLLGVGDIKSVFQPIVELDTGRTVAYEALARGPGGSPLAAPQSLFAAARQSGRLTELDLACQQAALQAARRVGLTDPWTVFVNVEPEAAEGALRIPGGTPAAAGPTRARAGLQVIAELTERSLTADPRRLLDLVERVRRRGWGIALDDVGADRASLALLPFIQPDVIKLDLRLIQDRPSAAVAEVFSAVNAEAERSGATVLAEGIESREHLSVALSLGATLGQGWLFGRPTAAPEIIPAPAQRLPGTSSRAPQASEATPFTLAAAMRPPRLGRKDLLIEVSKHLERQAAHSGEPTAVLASFQQAAFFTGTARRRYRQIADKATFVGVLGQDMPSSPMPGVRGGLLEPADPLASEWTVTVIGPHFASCLTARDLGDSDPDMERRFEFVLSHNRELVIQAATILLSRIAPRAGRAASQ